LEKGRTGFGTPVSDSGRINAPITIVGSNPTLTTNKNIKIMKKTLIALALILAINSIYSQNDRVTIDDCTNKTEIYGPSGVVCSNIDRTKWFTLKPNYQIDGNRLSCHGLIVIKSNIGGPSKKCQLLFSFKDGGRLKIKSTDESKSGNIFYFKLSELEFIILKSKKINYVRYINGIDNVSFQYKMGPDEINYYVNLFTNYNIRKINCE
jgi:hypothetical protein